jgi:hypothetical protein
MKESPPTVEYIESLFDTKEEVFGEAYRCFDLDDTLYELAFKAQLRLPEEFKEQAVVLPTARNTVDAFADNIGIDNVRVTVSRRKDTKTANEEGEQLRKFGQGLIYMTNVNASISQWRVAGKHYPLYGVTWFKDVYSADMWPDKPERKKGESDEDYQARVTEWENVCEGSLPITISAVHPRCMMFDKATMGQGWVIEHYEKPVSEMIRRYKRWTPRKSISEKSKVTYMDYWDKDYRCVLIDGQPVLKGDVVKHKYGFVPYVCIESGLGNISADNDLSKRFVGINRHVAPVLYSQSRDYSLTDILISKGGMPSGVLEGENAEAQGVLDLSYGTYTPLKSGVTLHEIKPMMAPPEVLQHFYASSEILDIHGITRSLQGQSEEGVRSGSDRRQLMAAGAAKFRYPQMAFKNRTASVLNNCARLMKILPGNVTVWSHTPSDEFYDVIDKDKIKEPINYHVEFPPVSEEEEYRKHDDLIRLRNGPDPLVTKTWARKQMSNVSVDDMEKQELKEKIRQLPSLAQASDQLMSVLVNTRTQQVMAAEGLLPPAAPSAGASPSGPSPQPPGGPPGALPGGMVAQNRQVAPPGSPQAMQNQLQGQRSPTPMSATQGRSPFAGGSQNHPRR